MGSASPKPDGQRGWNTEAGLQGIVHAGVGTGLLNKLGKPLETRVTATFATHMDSRAGSLIGTVVQAITGQKDVVVAKDEHQKGVQDQSGGSTGCFALHKLH